MLLRLSECRETQLLCAILYCNLEVELWHTVKKEVEISTSVVGK